MAEKLAQAPVQNDSGDLPEANERDKWQNEIQDLTDQQINQRITQYEKNMRIMTNELNHVNHGVAQDKKQIADNEEQIEKKKNLPYLVSNIVEVLDIEPEEADQEETGVEMQSNLIKGKCVIIKTSDRKTIFLPVPGFVEPSELTPGDLVGVNKDIHLIYTKLPTEYDTRIKSMEQEEKPTEEYTDIGGLDKQIEEQREAVVLPITHADKFEKIGITPPKGLLMYGPPGTGKTMMARACAAQSEACFLKLAGPQLVQMFIGDGAKIIRDAFSLAKEKVPCIIFIDELDAIGSKRNDNEKQGEREVQRTMLELLNQLDGFSSDTRIKVIAATNRPDILDPALLRSGRLDRKIEFPLPNEEARRQVMQIHSRKMNVSKGTVNFKELARSTEDFNCAQAKQVCVEAGMVALRRNSKFITHEDFVEGISVVLAKKKNKLNYYA